MTCLLVLRRGIPHLFILKLIKWKRMLTGYININILVLICQKALAFHMPNWIITLQFCNSTLESSRSFHPYLLTLIKYVVLWLIGHIVQRQSHGAYMMCWISFALLLSPITSISLICAATHDSSSTNGMASTTAAAVLLELGSTGG